MKDGPVQLRKEMNRLSMCLVALSLGRHVEWARAQQPIFTRLIDLFWLLCTRSTHSPVSRLLCAPCPARFTLWEEKLKCQRSNLFFHQFLSRQFITLFPARFSILIKSILSLSFFSCPAFPPDVMHRDRLRSLPVKNSSRLLAWSTCNRKICPGKGN